MTKKSMGRRTPGWIQCMIYEKKNYGRRRLEILLSDAPRKYSLYRFPKKIFVNFNEDEEVWIFER